MVDFQMSDIRVPTVLTYVSAIQMFTIMIPTVLTGQENSGQIVLYSDHRLNNGPFDYQTTFDYSNTRLVRCSVPTVFNL